MGFMDTASNFASNMVGKVEKAVIRVIDDENTDKKVDGGSVTLLKATDRDDSGSKLAGIKGIQTSTGKLKVGMKTLGDLAADLDTYYKSGKQYKVQFNPATLQLNATGGGKTEIKDYAKRDDDPTGRDIGIRYESAPFQVTLEVDLILNKVNPNDAFVEVMQSMATIKGAASTIKNVIGKSSSYSIQNDIEGLIAATRKLSTCLISFSWGKMCYNGKLQNLNATYTVFNPKGEPVAGTVHLSMILIDENVNEKGIGKWVQAYEDAFKDPRALGSSEQSFGNNAFTNFTF